MEQKRAASPHFEFARRTGWDLQENELGKVLNDLKKTNAKIYDLTTANPTQCSLNFPPPSALAPFMNTENLIYRPDSQGALAARKAIFDYYNDQGVPLGVDQVILTASTSEAYSFLFRLLANPADNVLLPKPSYPLFDFLVGLNDLQLKHYSLNYQNRWSVDFAAMQANINSATKAIVFVNPNNPTGSYITSEEMLKINAVCQQNNLAIIADEVFWDYPLENVPQRRSFAGNNDVLTFTLGGVSKTFGLPQMKCGWIIVSGPDQRVEEALERLAIITDTYLSVNTPVQNALPVWFKHRDDFQAPIKSRIQDNYAWLKNQLNGHVNVRLLDTEGGWYALLKAELTADEEKWCVELLKQTHVYIHPGYFFEFAEEGYIVLSLLTEPKELQAGVAMILDKLGRTKG